MPTPMITLRWPLWLGATLALLCSPAPARGQDSDPPLAPWAFRTRVALSGNADESEPSGFTAYSGLTLEAAVSRDLGRRLAAEASARTESREIDREVGGDPAERLGSLEILPLTAALLYRPPFYGSVRPYAGAIVCLTLVWEKSGFLDTLDVPIQVDPGIQLGLDLVLSATAFLNLDVRWNTLTLDIESEGERLARLRVNPLTLGLGVGFRF